MTTSTCVRCGRPTPDGYADVVCGVERPRAWLAEIADMVPAARDVAQRQARRGTGGGGASGKPGSQEPIDLGATARLDAVQNALTTIARDIAETRGAEIDFAGSKDHGVSEPIVEAAKWLSGQMEWVRHAADGTEPMAIRVLAEIETCARVMRSVVDRHQPGRYAGPCSTVGEDGQTCGQDVLARPGATFGTCRACGAEYDVDEQQEWMRKEIEGYLARPMEITGILLRLGFKVGYSTIAAYAAKGQLVAHGQDEKGRPLFRIGDVMNLRMGVKAS